MKNDPTRRKPEIIVLGGPNGAGKTTAARFLLPETIGIDQFVNADLIAQGLSPLAPQTTAIQAGRLMLDRIHRLASRRESFAFETTLASRTFAPFLRGAQKNGYRISVIYLWLRSADLAVARVKARVERGGHNVPEVDIRRRYIRGLKNFFQLYVPLSDRWDVCDNSNEDLEVVSWGGKDIKTKILDEDRFELMERIANES